MNHVNIQPEVLDVLKQASCDGSKLLLVGQLSRDLYTKTAKIIELLGGKWNRGAKAHIFDGDCAERIDEAVMTGSVVNSKQLFQFFETPQPLAARMVEWARINPGDTVLEPSAGKGAILSEIFKAEPDAVYFCELQDENCATIKARFPAAIFCGNDFLKQENPVFDVIVMNPPFRNGQDIQHVRHAYSLLRSGGRLAAITSPAWQYRQDRKFVEFRDWFTGDAEELEAGTFKKSGTDIRTLLLTITK